MRLFGPTQEDIWKMFSEDIGAKFIVEDSVFKKYKVIKEFHDWSIVLEMGDSTKREPAYTRICCMFLNKHGFKFKVFGEYFNNYFSNYFDMQDIKVNYDDFSDKLIIRSNSEVAIKKFLQNDTIRELISMQPDILLEIVRQESYEITDNADSTMIVKIPGIIKNNEVLKNLFELVGESLLEIENISSEIENLQVNNFTHFDIIKNSVKNSLLESESYNKIKKNIIDNVNKVIDKTSHHYSHEKDETNKSQLTNKNSINKNQINEVYCAENSDMKMNGKSVCDYTNTESLLASEGNINKTIQTASINANNSKVDLSNLSIDTSNLNIDTSNLNIDTSNLNIDTSDLQIDDGYLKIDDSYLKFKDSYLKIKE